METQTTTTAITTKEYASHVREAKLLIDKMAENYFRICDIALKVCTIRHGGISDGLYTITRFANDIGMNKKTLQNWLTAYRTVVVPVGKDKFGESVEAWSKIRKIEAILNDEQRIARKTLGIEGRKFRPITHTVKDIERVATFIEEKPFIGEFRTSKSSVKRLLFILSKRDLSIISDESKSEMMKLLDDCSDIINEHLTKKHNRKKK